MQAFEKKKRSLSSDLADQELQVPDLKKIQEEHIRQWKILLGGHQQDKQADTPERLVFKSGEEQLLLVEGRGLTHQEPMLKGNQQEKVVFEHGTNASSSQLNR